jgi:hypothetical protein
MELICSGAEPKWRRAKLSRGARRWEYGINFKVEMERTRKELKELGSAIAAEPVSVTKSSEPEAAD